jgi:hypothetical protein
MGTTTKKFPREKGTLGLTNRHLESKKKIVDFIGQANPGLTNSWRCKKKEGSH